MCEKIRCEIKGQITTITFEDDCSALPVRLKNGRYQTVPWGNKISEDIFPLGGVAHIDHINAGKWDRYAPKPVKIPYLSYMQTSLNGEECWFDNDQPIERHLKGLLAFIDKKYRVYIVVKNAELFDADMHKNFPCRVYVPTYRPLK